MGRRTLALACAAMFVGTGCDGDEDSSQSDRGKGKTGTEPSAGIPEPPPTPTESCKRLLAPDSGATGACRKEDGQTVVIASLRRRLELQDISLRATRIEIRQAINAVPARGRWVLVTLTVTAARSTALDWQDRLRRRSTLVIGEGLYRPAVAQSRELGGSPGPIRPGKKARRVLAFEVPAWSVPALRSPGSVLQVISSAEIGADHTTETATTIGRIRMWR